MVNQSVVSREVSTIENVRLCLGCKAYLNSSVAVAISGNEIHASDLLMSAVIQVA